LAFIDKTYIFVLVFYR